MPGIIKNVLSKIRRRGIFFRTFVILMLLSLILIGLFAVMIIPRAKGGSSEHA